MDQETWKDSLFWNEDPRAATNPTMFGCVGLYEAAANPAVFGGVGLCLYEAAANLAMFGGIAARGWYSEPMLLGVGCSRLCSRLYKAAANPTIFGGVGTAWYSEISIRVASCTLHLSDVNAAEENCQLCSLLLHTVKSVCNNNELDVQIVRDRLFLKVGTKGPQILRLCSNSEYSNNDNKDIPISFPVLPKAGSPTYFALLRTWLRWCDESYSCNKRNTNIKLVLPTRLLWVGNLDDKDYNPDILHLKTSTDKREGNYIALSHCWGELPTEVKKHFCTTPDNISRRQRGFSIWELPRTFQDAVKVTRELHVPYLWIDSLCIIQYGDSGEDWEREARRMEEVFSGAYCIIAATSASNSYTGFLERNVRSEYVHIQDAPWRRFYVCDDIDDFEKDVEKAWLNTRAWVMQERVLSRRTIHFTANQTYWECGEGVYCENLTRLNRDLLSPHRKRFFIRDLDFPGQLLRSGYQRTIEFIHFLFEDYSKRGLTEKTDRCVAISGLEARIAGALQCKSKYGIFERCLHRNLLWQASRSKMERIEYETRHVPSWSWMAYNGGIQFMDIPFGTIDWIDNLQFDKEYESALIADVGKFRDCTMKPDGDHYAVLNLFGRKGGWIRYDVVQGKELRQERCVVVGKMFNEGVREYCILVVRPTNVDGEYSRVGVGLIQSHYVVRQRLNVRVV
ncbi:heterokaryon incompatibility protein-domain-containing protein [Phaeosphaeriaceae sp. PMI808]|nr:heterokaryon incompatibility protein-domain-containing protein [Phaeosphaeriaceae sp. PMI808]